MDMTDRPERIKERSRHHEEKRSSPARRDRHDHRYSKDGSRREHRSRHSHRENSHRPQSDRQHSRSERHSERRPHHEAHRQSLEAAESIRNDKGDPDTQIVESSRQKASRQPEELARPSKTRERSRERDTSKERSMHAKQLARADFERSQRGKAAREGGNGSRSISSPGEVRERSHHPEQRSGEGREGWQKPSQKGSWKRGPQEDPVAGGGKWGHDKYEEVKDSPPQEKDPLTLLSWW